MYVVGSIRSGSTAFAIAKAVEYNVPFVGDLTPTNVYNTGSVRTQTKTLYHETGINASMTLSDYVTGISNLNDPACMYLVPAHGAVVSAWDDAVGFITRRNIKDIARSQFCYLSKINAARKPFQGEMYYYLERALFGAIVLLEYCKRTNKEVTWYEDTFDVNTTYTEWNESPYLHLLEPKVDAYLAEFDPQAINANITLK